MSDCVFCDIVAGTAPADIVFEWPDAVAFPPVPNPVVVGGHLLIVPKRHVRDMVEDPAVTGLVAQRAAELAIHLGWVHGHFVFNLGEFGGQLGLPVPRTLADELPLTDVGVVVAVVDLVGICPGGQCDCGPWSGPLSKHWEVANPRPLERPVVARGHLQLWDIDLGATA